MKPSLDQGLAIALLGAAEALLQIDSGVEGAGVQHWRPQISALASKRQPVSWFQRCLRPRMEPRA
ncbi:MAG: hypothetical protein AAGA46_00200 [Cyanobacteria bacterium P01_F01_bin.13]